VNVKQRSRHLHPKFLGEQLVGVWLWGQRLSNKTAPHSAMALATSRKREGGGSHHSDAGYPRNSVPTSWTPSSGARKLPARRLRPSRTIRRPARYTFDVLDEEAEPLERDEDESQFPDTKNGSQHSDQGDLYSTNSEAEEDARIERSMGVIRKNAASRGTEGGTKYHCDVCSIDITSTVWFYSPSERCPTISIDRAKWSFCDL
jgi:hypothetical protein